jgi:Arc/MetJ-type ribon-helix-helix transcriptional regulator
MQPVRVSVSLDPTIVARIDRQVADGRFASRSQAILQAIQEKLNRTSRARLARECAKLNPLFEQAFAEATISY